jgi:LPXTG-site transpeptidase (sortase) family protein
MFKSRWMVLAGVILILAGLANTLWGLRQASSPFDIPGDPANGEVVLAQPLSNEHSSVSTTSSTITTNGTLDPSASSVYEQWKVGELSPTPVFKAENPSGLVPDRISIPAIQLDAPVIPAKVKEINFQGQKYYQWVAPDEFAAGWHNTSALLGDQGNVVLNGHHNEFGEVFGQIIQLHEGDIIELYSGDYVYKYKVAYTLILPERFKSLTIRQENAMWIMPTTDTRLTLITCWPPSSNTHRVIVVAFPVKN